LLERSLVLTRAHRLDVHLELDLAETTSITNGQRGLEITEAVAHRAATLGDEAGVALARLVRANMRMRMAQESADEVERLAREALPLLEAADDHHGLAEVWHALAYGVANMRGSFEEWAFAAEQVIQHARLAWPRDRGLHTLSKALVEGPRPARRALETLDSLLPGQPPPRDMAYRAMLIAMLDRLDEAKELAAATDERLREFGFRAGAAQQLGRIAIIAGDQETAAKQLRRFCIELEAMDYRATLSTYAPLLGRVLSGLGRHDEAEPLAAQGRDLGDPDDAWTQGYWRLAQALVRSARGRHAEAERLAREAVEIADQTDSLWIQGDAYCDLARVLEARGRRNDAIAALHAALDRYERKQIIPLARRTRALLVALQEPI
jgi:tetratricopeptide (TPR) repeat protein